MDAAPVDIVDRAPAVVVSVDADSCDACPAAAEVRAFVFVKLASGKTLAYCGHHGALFIPALIRGGALVVDLRHLILR